MRIGCSTSFRSVVCQLARAPARIDSCETKSPMAKSAQGPAAAASSVAKRSTGSGSLIPK
jgi:hypothetical protein